MSDKVELVRKWRRPPGADYQAYGTQVPGPLHIMGRYSIKTVCGRQLRGIVQRMSGYPAESTCPTCVRLHSEGRENPVRGRR